MLGTHKHAVQTGSAAAYAEVTLEVDENATNGTISFDDSVFNYYRAAAEFGIRHLLTWRHADIGKYDITVRELLFNPVDTTQVAVAFAAAHALLAALGEPPDRGPTFDKTTFRYSF
jgi:hypothetical protein